MTDRVLQWQKDWAEAVERFQVTAEAVEGDVVIVDGDPGNGTRVRVAAVWLRPNLEGSLGGNVLVSVLRPWQAAYPVLCVTGSPLSMVYVSEKFSGAVTGGGRHGGDMAGVFMTINHALRLIVRRIEEGQHV